MNLAQSTIDDRVDDMILRNIRPQILLAEDDPEMREIISLQLHGGGYEVVEARDGIELVRAIHRFEMSMLPMGLIITDVRMPGFTGLETLEYLQYAGLSVPVIVITGYGDARTRAEARDLGAALVLDKPIEIDRLLDKVAEIVPPQAY